MTKDNRLRYETRARILKGLAHPSRLLIVDELGKGERCVQELTDLIGADKSTVSKHLGLLKEVGLVTDEKRGTQVYYRMNVPCLSGLFTCIESMVKLNAERHMAAV